MSPYGDSRYRLTHHSREARAPIARAHDQLAITIGRQSGWFMGGDPQLATNYASGET
jgi:hypothetical protein